MAKVKEEETNIRNFLQEERDRINREQPIIKSRWYVSEVTPGYDEPGYYGGWVSPVSRRVSEYFYNSADVSKWLETHEPDEPKNKFEVRQENLRQIKQWVAY